ncbi:hypothetical protein [Micromonospora ureilytica]|uniref:hypothetical protein n=1 Tax=Micromonospora ureilytica TaxID=709868 RepID=UPI002E10B79A|nr:hypothetical protein OHB55_14745 [Micromonospora ureilytica]
MTPRRLVTLATAVTLLLTLTACGSDAPAREEASQEAHSAAARQASASSAEQISTLLSAVTQASPLRSVATSTRDTCHAGVTNALWPHDDYRLSCSLSDIRYFGADGDILDVVREVDKRAKAAGLIPTTTSAIEDVETYYAANGKTDDGLLLPPPGLSYLVPAHDWTVQVRWTRDVNALINQAVPDLTWPTVFVEADPVDFDTLRSGLLRRSEYLVTVSSGTTYYEVPWPS